MSRPANSHVILIDAPLRWLALAVVSVDALTFPVARLTHLLTDGVLRVVIVISAGFLATLFLRALFDPACHRAVNAANKELKGDRPLKLRWALIFDRTWGLFGSRMGGGYLKLIRPILLAEFVLGLLTNGSGESGLPLLLAAAGFGTAIMLTIIQLKDHYSPVSGAAALDG